MTDECSTGASKTGNELCPHFQPHSSSQKNPIPVLPHASKQAAPSSRPLRAAKASRLLPLRALRGPPSAPKIPRQQQSITSRIPLPPSPARCGIPGVMNAGSLHKSEHAPRLLLVRDCHRETDRSSRGSGPDPRKRAGIPNRGTWTRMGWRCSLARRGLEMLGSCWRRET